MACTKLKRVRVDFGDKKSISKAEKKKSRYENEGYELKTTKKVGLDKFVLTYRKEGKKRQKLRSI